MNGEAEARLLAIAATQLGVFALVQATECGVTRAMIRTRLAQKAWERIHRGVFRVCGHPALPEATHMAAILATGVASARSSYRAGAWLWDMTQYEQKPEVTLTSDTRIRIAGVRVHRTITTLDEPTIRKGVPTTNAAETLLDLGAVRPLSDVQRALDRGIASKTLTPMSALAELSRRGKEGVRGTAALRKLLDEAGLTGSHHPSVLEAKTRRLIKRAGLPQPECELVVGKNGEYRLDFCWPELLLAIEVDGWMYHSSLAAFYGNKSRKNTLTIEGYAVLEYTWIHVTKYPTVTMREMKTAYAARAGRLVGR